MANQIICVLAETYECERLCCHLVTSRLLIATSNETRFLALFDCFVTD